MNSKQTSTSLKQSYYDDLTITEIGVDEVGRGPMFGRVYTAAVILPKGDTEFKYYLLKDSKKFHSKKKINEVSDYIKENAIAWSIQWEDESVIDKINIRNATHSAMHKSIKEIYNPNNNTILLVDGNDFKPFVMINSHTNVLEQVPHVSIEGGDNKYCAIAAASILAKVARDAYIDEMCELHPYLNEKYDLNKNKGYGTKKHMDGIRTHGITEWHRKSFGICKTFCDQSDE
jgi:ribonuclease HII